MSIFASLGPVAPSNWSFSSCLSDTEAETFESTIPEGVFSDEDYGVALVIDEAGLRQRGAMAGYATADAAMKAIKIIVMSAGMRPAKPTKMTEKSGSSSNINNNCKKSASSNGSNGNSNPLSSNVLLFSGTAEGLHLAMSKLRMAAWLRHHPGLPDIGRLYAVYPQSISTAKYVPQDSVFNEI